MTPEMKTILKITLSGGLFVAAVGMGVARFRDFSRTGEQGACIWFYNEGKRELYAVPRDTIPPDNGKGVRAIVVACPKEPSKQQIAYLETYTPEYQQLLEGIRAAQAAGEPMANRFRRARADSTTRTRWSGGWTIRPGTT